MNCLYGKEIAAECPIITALGEDNLQKEIPVGTIKGNFWQMFGVNGPCYCCPLRLRFLYPKKQ